MVRETPWLDDIHIYDDSQSIRYPFHDGRSFCKEGLSVLFVADVLLYSGLFNTLSFLDVAAG